MAQNMRCELDLQEHCKQKVAFDEMAPDMPDEVDKLELGDQKIAFDEIPQECDYVIHDNDVAKEKIVATVPKSKSKRKGLKRHNKVGPLVVDSLCKGDIISRSMSATHNRPDETESVSCWDGLTSAAAGMKRRFIRGCQRLVSRVRDVNCFRQKAPPRSPSPKSVIGTELEPEVEHAAEPDQPEVQFTADKKQPKLEVEPTAPVKFETISIIDTTGAEYGKIELEAGVAGDELIQAVAKKLVKDVIVQAQARLMAEQAKLMIADIMAKAECNLRYLEIE